MKKRTTFWFAASAAIALFFIAICAVYFSIYWGRGSKDPDYYEVFGFVAALALILLSGLSGCFAFGIWLSDRNRTTELFSKRNNVNDQKSR